MDYPKRKQIRLPNLDYRTPGAYFVTICTQNRRCVLSTVHGGDPCGQTLVELTEYGEIVAQCLAYTETLYAVTLKPWVIMPNHIHFICTIDQQRATASTAPTLGRIVGAFKSLSANRCREAGLSAPLWQRSYYEHVIRTEADDREICEYIETNPAKWAEDPYHTS